MNILRYNQITDNAGKIFTREGQEVPVTKYFSLAFWAVLRIRFHRYQADPDPGF
jgi:hypothetical protein